MLDDVPCDEGDALLRADDGLELRPLGLQLLAAVDLLALGCLLETGVDVRLLLFVDRQPRETALVVDRHRGSVLDGPLDVVDADVVAEHGTGVRVR